jgi:hypothetical protein
LGGLTLPELLKAESDAGVRSSQKAVIMIHLSGGPPHQDTFDLKPDVPNEFRGEFRPIPTNVPGIQICELLPRLSKIMDKLVPVRTLVGSIDLHTEFQCVTAKNWRVQPPGGWPTLGAVVSKLQGPSNAFVPPHVELSKSRDFDIFPPGSGYLGPAYAPLRPDGKGFGDMTLNDVSLSRFEGRKKLLASLNAWRRELDAGLPRAVDSFTERAFGILSSSRLREAFDLDREDPRVLERYLGNTGSRTFKYATTNVAEHLPKFLLARRLVEAGARVVTMSFGSMDWHENNFDSARQQLPLLDQGLSALIEDLHERGLEKDVSVVAWGEFGRTPRINKNAGRDHWPPLGCALLAGGGMRTGQVLGKTDRLAAEVIERPVHFQEVFATLYHNLGIDTKTTTLTDLSGRPRYILDQVGAASVPADDGEAAGVQSNPTPVDVLHELV